MKYESGCVFSSCFFSCFFSCFLWPFDLPDDLRENHGKLVSACKKVKQAPEGFVDCLRNNPELADWCEEQMHGNDSVFDVMLIIFLKECRKLSKAYPEWFQTLKSWLYQYYFVTNFPEIRDIRSFIEKYPELAEALRKLMKATPDGNGFVLQLLVNLDCLEQRVCEGDQNDYIRLVDQLRGSPDIFNKVMRELCSRGYTIIMYYLVTFFMDNPRQFELSKNLFSALGWLLDNKIVFISMLSNNEEYIEDLFFMLSISPNHAGTIVELCSEPASHFIPSGRIPGISFTIQVNHVVRLERIGMMKEVILLLYRYVFEVYKIVFFAAVLTQQT